MMSPQVPMISRTGWMSCCKKGRILHSLFYCFLLSCVLLRGTEKQFLVFNEKKE